MGWKATGSSSLPCTNSYSLALSWESRPGRPMRWPIFYSSSNPFRQSCGSELSSGRGVLISPAGPLFVQRQLVISAAVRRVWILDLGVCGALAHFRQFFQVLTTAGGRQAHPTTRSEDVAWEATGSPTPSEKKMCSNRERHTHLHRAGGDG